MVTLLTESGKEIICFQTDIKERVVKYFYSQENEHWHTNVHKRSGTVEENIADTLSAFDENYEFYLVMDGSVFAGFFCKMKMEGYNVLDGFHVGKEYRNSDFLNVFWKIVYLAIGKPLHCALCAKNEPAINHLKRQGFEIFNEVEESGINVVVLIKN